MVAILREYYHFYTSFKQVKAKVRLPSDFKYYFLTLRNNIAIYFRLLMTFL